MKRLCIVNGALVDASAVQKQQSQCMKDSSQCIVAVIGHLGGITVISLAVNLSTSNLGGESDIDNLYYKYAGS